MQNDEWFESIHARLVARDPIASAELAEQVFERMIEKLTADYPTVSDRVLISDACGDALLNYIRGPEAYDPSQRGLWGYLIMSAKGDLLNSLDRLKREKNRENRAHVVEPEEISRNVLSELAERLERTEVENAIASLFEDERDRQAAMMIIDGEKSTDRFAEVFDCGEAAKEEREKIVKRHKDRINKRMKRELGSKNG